MFDRALNKDTQEEQQRNEQLTREAALQKEHYLESNYIGKVEFEERVNANIAEKNMAQHMGHHVHSKTYNMLEQAVPAGPTPNDGLTFQRTSGHLLSPYKVAGIQHGVVQQVIRAPRMPNIVEQFHHDLAYSHIKTQNEEKE